LKSFTEPVKEVEPNIFVINPLVIPTYGSRAAVSFNQLVLLNQIKSSLKKLGMTNVVNMVFNPAAGMVAGKLGETTLIYYCVDEYTAFTGVTDGLRVIEEELFRKSDLVIVSSERLFESKKHFNANTFVIRHGTDWRHFRRSLDKETPIPPEIARLPKPIIGFHGLLADWVDFELLRKTAERFSCGSVILIGKITVDAEKKIKILDDVPNIHFLGRKPYGELPGFCKGFDLALNPFEINPLTLAANPLKVREYLAAGLQVVSTDIPEVRYLKDCLVGKDHDEFIAKIEFALQNPKPRALVSEGIRHESWDAKIDELRAIMSQHRG
jgi:glycosyltransferase involved in cell wall biosynthesis